MIELWQYRERRSQPTMQVVLGSLSPCTHSHLHFIASPILGNLCFTTASSPPSSSPTTFIGGGGGGGSSRRGDSSGGIHRRSVTLGLNKDGRVLMEDRKGPFDQFKVKSLILSTIRVTAINVSSTLSTYFSDQLASEQSIESKVESGEISSREADDINSEWEEREWARRKEALPTKIGYALCRFHVCTAITRLYEFIVAQYVLKIDRETVGSFGWRGEIKSLERNSGISSASTTTKDIQPVEISLDRAITIMDNLTRDTFLASLRTSQILHNTEHSPGKVISSVDGKETSTSRELFRRMFSTCLWANAIPFLAELTVQQGVLIYGYWVYYTAKQKKKEKRSLYRYQKETKEKDEECSTILKEGSHESIKNTTVNIDDGEEDIGEPAYALSFMFRSSRLSIARSMSWISASAGGALGCTMYPGWGTVFGTQVGDAMIGALID